MRGAVVAVVVVVGGCVTPPASLSSTDYNGALQKLVDGPKEKTTATAARLAQAPAQALTSGLGGVSFGMSMQEVIDIWGRPNAVWTQDEGVVQLSISYSVFEFRRDRLFDISIHQADLPDLAVGDGAVAMGKPCPDLLTVFPDALRREGSESVSEVGLKGDVILRVQQMNQEIISIEIIRE